MVIVSKHLALLGIVRYYETERLEYVSLTYQCQTASGVDNDVFCAKVTC